MFQVQGSMWFIGVEFQKTKNLSVDLTHSINSFTDTVFRHAMQIKMYNEGMTVTVRIFNLKILIFLN